MLRRFTRHQFGGLVAVLLVSLVGVGMSARASFETAGQNRAAATKATDYEADGHFPGAADYQRASDDAALAAPAAGTTGTVALPDLPVPENAVLDPTLRPAPPFISRGTSIDHARALECLTTAIYYEAASEPDDGQRAVAQVILNRVRHPTFPATVCGVVYQGSEKTGCQFSFACDGAMARIPARAAWQRAARVASAALAGSVFAPVGMATHYHTYAVTPNWSRSLVMTGVFGVHFFHRWKGYWGTTAAFRQGYAGGEPVPGPHARAMPPATLVASLPALPAMPATAPPLAVPPQRADAAAIQRDYAQSGEVQPRYAVATTDDSQILDRWKDSGRPLR